MRDKLTILLLMLAIGAATAHEAAAVNVWVTAGDKSQLLAQQSDFLFQSGTGTGGTPISVVPTTTYQTMSGFGAAMTDSSAWLLQNKLTAAQRDKLMRQLFSPQSGIGLNYLRVPIGASDFTASNFYTYDDNPAGGTDEFQQQFSVAHDQSYIIPRLQQASQLNPNLQLLASPWSAPAWMKTNNSLQGGSLAAQWEGSYTLYLAKFLEAYQAAGLPFDTITLQNEPLNTSNYPTMSMSAAQQIDLIKNHVGPIFAAKGLTTKVIAYDHNWDNTAYPLQVLGDAAASQYVAGTAFHAYAGDVSAQTTVHNAYPNKDVYFTEITGGNWATNFADNIVWNFQNIFIGATRNWAKTALLWNLALDQNGNPHLNGCSGCRGVVTVNNSNGAITFNEEFYSLGQVTKVVQPNAIRIGSTTTSAVNTVAFLNPDGTQALIALNPNASATTVRVVENGQHFNYAIPAKSVVSFLWSDKGADFNNGGFDDGGFQQGGGSLDAWTVFGNNGGNVSAATEAVLDGDRSLKLFGQFNGIANTSGVSQGITVSPGDRVQASASALVRLADSITNTNNVAQLKIEYYSQFGGTYGSASFLGETQMTLVDGSTTNDSWLERQLTGIAPTGAAEARIVLQFLQPAGQLGAVHIDHVSFGIVNPAHLAGDYNDDGVVDTSDYDTWRNGFGSTSQLDADGNNNGVVDAADFAIWRDNFGATVAGNGAATAANAPEASGLALALWAVIGAIGFHARRARGICSSCVAVELSSQRTKLTWRFPVN
jgi:glucosylceramidase